MEISAAYKAWLEYAADRLEDDVPFNYRQARLYLREVLPPDFIPGSFPWLWNGSRVTALGLQCFAPEHPLFARIQKALDRIRAKVLADPSRSEFTAQEIADDSASERDIRIALSFLSDLTNCMSGYSSPNGLIATFSVQDNEFARFLNLPSLADLMAARMSQIEAQNSELFRPDTESTPPEQYESRKNTAFVLMEMSNDNPELEDRLRAIKSTCSKFGVEAFRIDDVEHSDRITDLILRKIHEAEFIIADLTGERPNVYYEIGFAHALDKRPILIRKKGTALHFDLSVHNVPEYQNLTELERILLNRFESIFGRGPRT